MEQPPSAAAPTNSTSTAPPERQHAPTRARRRAADDEAATANTGLPLALATVDGEPFSVERARALARGVWLAGFALLPMAWAANCWLWWPHAKGGPGADPVVKKC
jgi:hypothetical protein